jgi:hypothetical protein
MKTKLLLTAALSALAGFSSNAQCNPAIPATAVVVNSTQTISGGFDTIWVCTADTLYSDGGLHNIFLETGAVMTTSGGVDTIYVKSGASFFMDGGVHVIYYEILTDLNITGGIATEVLCDTLQYNYINAPKGGCIPTGVAAAKGKMTGISVYPNPVIDNIYFDLTNCASNNYTVNIYSTCGKIIIAKTIAPGRNSISAENFSSGIYCYTLLNGEGKQGDGKFIVE